MENDETKQTIEFYKKRLEIQAKQSNVLKEENAVLRKELDSLKKVIKDIVLSKGKPSSQDGNKNDNLRQILEFQHKRIETLEHENQEMSKKYEKLLFEHQQKLSDLEEEECEMKKEGKSKVLFAKYSENTEELKKANKTILMLENKLKDLTASYAKEIIDLKTKLTTQTASMIINKKELGVNDARGHSAGLENKDFLFKKRDNLQPLEKNTSSAHKIQNKSMFEQDSLFSYSKSGKR